VLSLYTPHTIATPLSASHYLHYPVAAFYGTQAMYYPEPVRIGFCNFLRDNGVEDYRGPYDLVLREYLRLMRLNLFVTDPCLVQHIGVISTGLGSYHQSTRFRHAL
jgi:hypothetical protein